MVALATLVVGAKILMRDDSVDDSFDTTAAATAVQDLVDRSQVSAEVQDSVSMSACPFGDLDTLVAAAPAGVQQIAVDARQTPEVDQVYASGQDHEPPIVQCFYLTSGDGAQIDNQVGLFAAPAVDGEYHQVLEGVFVGVDLVFADDRPFRGGTMVAYCGSKPDGSYTFCESDWYDGNLQVGAYLTGADQSSDIARTWLAAVLPDVIDALPQNSTSIEVTPS